LTFQNFIAQLSIVNYTSTPTPIQPPCSELRVVSDPKFAGARIRKAGGRNLLLAPVDVGGAVPRKWTRHLRLGIGIIFFYCKNASQCAQRVAYSATTSPCPPPGHNRTRNIRNWASYKRIIRWRSGKGGAYEARVGLVVWYPRLISRDVFRVPVSSQRRYPPRATRNIAGL
jgi:hypothetical protein